MIHPCGISSDNGKGPHKPHPILAYDGAPEFDSYLGSQICRRGTTLLIRPDNDLTER